MAFQLQLFSPWNNQTRAELALKSSFFQLRLGQKQTHLFRTDTLPLSRSGSRAIQNIPWPFRLFNRAHIGVSPTQLTFRWQFCPQGIFMATLIVGRTETHFWAAEIGAHEVGKVLFLGTELTRWRTFLKVYTYRTKVAWTPELDHVSHPHSQSPDYQHCKWGEGRTCFVSQ